MKYRKKDGEVSNRRISIRVSPALHRELSDKLHKLDEDWQSIGMRLWLEWLRSTADPSENFYTNHRDEHDMLDYIFEEGDSEARQGITANLKYFNKGIRYDPQRTPAGQEQIRKESLQPNEKQDPKKKNKTG